MQPPCHHHLADTTQVGHGRVGGSWGEERGCRQPTPFRAAAVYSSPGKPGAALQASWTTSATAFDSQALRSSEVLRSISFTRFSCPSPASSLWPGQINTLPQLQSQGHNWASFQKHKISASTEQKFPSNLQPKPSAAGVEMPSPRTGWEQGLLKSGVYTEDTNHTVLTETAPVGHRAGSPGMTHVRSGRGVTIYYLLIVNIPLTHWNFEFTLPTLLVFKTSTAFEK